MEYADRPLLSTTRLEELSGSSIWEKEIRLGPRALVWATSSTEDGL